MSLTTARELDVCDAVVTDINAISGIGLTFTALQVFSFGFTDGDLNSLRVVVRPYETEFDAESRGDEQDDYQIQVGVYKMVGRKDVANIKLYFNLMRMIANLYPIDRQMMVGASNVLVKEKRFFPLYFRSDKIMDNIEGSTRFISHLLLTFREWVAE